MAAITTALRNVIALLTLVLSGPNPAAAADSGEIPSIHNGPVPAAGREVWTLEERWRLSPEEDRDLLVGRIQQVIAGEDGMLYLLDQQLAQVHVFSAEGDYLRSLSREGDGPGESRSPIDLVFLPSGGLGLVQAFPARVIGVDLKGDPLGAIDVRAPKAVKGTDRYLRRVRCRGGTFAYSGQTLSTSRRRSGRVRKMLVVCDDEGKEKVVIHESETRDIMDSKQWVEKEEYFVHDRWELGPGGRVFLAPEFGRYAVHVYEPDGTPSLIISRDFEPRRRTNEEKEGKGVRVQVSGREIDIENIVEDDAPCIDDLHVDSDGALWVRHARSRMDQPEGVLETWDLFDARGRFQRQVSLAVDADPAEDQLFHVGDRRFVLVKGYEERISITIGSGDGEGVEEGTPPFEVIYYEAVPSD